MTPSTRLPAIVLVLLIAAYALPGLFGHDPWKPDEPFTFGAVLHMTKTGDWVVPTVGAQPFVEKPPLYYWAAWATGTIASPLLPLHDAARLASLVFVLASLAAVAAAARLVWGEEAAGASALLFLATLGLESLAQRMQVDLALLAGFAFAVLGFAACARQWKWGGAMLGLGVGVGFLGKGPIAPAVIGLTAVLLPAFFAPWRRRGYFLQLAIAAAVAAPMLAIWPLALHARSESLFNEWFWDNNVGRFAGFATSKLGATSARGEWSQTLAWFLFPAWVYLVGALVRARRAAWHEPGMQIGLTLTLVGALVLALSASIRAVYVLPLVPGLVVAAVAGVRAPESVYERALGIVAGAVGGAAALVIWIVWAMLAYDGAIPDEWRLLTRSLPNPFRLPLQPVAIVAAALLTGGFIALVCVRRRLAAPGLALWVGALALVWGLAHTLWLPWLDAARSYRSVMSEVSARLPADVGCIVMDGPGESERAMVEYFTGVTPRQRFVREGDCRALLWMGNAQKGHPWPGPGWRFVWGGARPGDRDERLELFLRQ